MSRITSTGITTNAGLISGIPIEETVNQLIALSARPRDTLSSRTDGLRSEQSAVDQLSALVLSFQFSADRFSANSTFTGRSVTSSSDAISVSVASGATPALGSYQFTPLQTASAHQLVSGTFTDLTEGLGDGTLRFGFGGRVDKGVDLTELNGGAGVAAGEIKITDRNGDTAVIDLRSAQTVDDVLRTINATTDISVTATTQGDAFVLTDNSGGGGTLSVTDVGLGSTATALGLTNAASGDTITGNDVYGLTVDSRLDSLNDGLGVRTSSSTETNDLSFQLRDGTTAFDVNLSDATTIGDVVDAINNAEDNGGLLTASITDNGIVLTDNTGSTAGNLIVASESGFAESLGIATGDAGVAENTVSSRLISGLQDTLVRNLNGGQELTLGSISITDRSGASDDIDLSSAETLEEIIDAINNNGTVDVTAAVNEARSGIVITDNTGGTASNLIVADTGGTTTATDLGIVVDAAATSVDSGSLSRKTISEATLLTSLNGGAGIDLGDFRITDSAGNTSAVDLNTPGSEATSVGDVIDRINDLSIGVTASINDTGDGILLTDTAGGSGTLTVAEVGNGTTAADLNLVGASSTSDGSGRQTIDGTFGYEIDLSTLSATNDSVALSSLNNGDGVQLGVFEITNSLDQSASVQLGAAGDEAFTIDDVLAKINETNIGVEASLNDAGTGIVLTDTTDGDGTLSVRDQGDGRAALDLGLVGSSSTTNDNGQQTIDSGFLFASDAAETSALDELVERINDLDAGVTASVLTDLNGSRLVITADNTGSANELLIDTGSTSLSFTETSRPTDAAGLFGPGGGAGVVVRSQSNQFNDIVDGLDISINQATGASATVDVSTDDAPLLDAAQDFVDSYNSLRATLDGFTSFDVESLTTGVLFGRNEALRVDTDLSRILSGRIVTGTDYGSLEAVGITLNDDGTLALNRSELSAAFADDPAGVERLFTDDTDGVVTRLTTAIDQLAGDDNSLLSSRSSALQRTIDSNDDRITSLTESLERERERLLLEFIRLEETIALLQSNNTAIESIQPISIQTSSN